ncbi:branched-chain amino acid ABC transporter ATP-binding protein/permease [Ancylobacter amanitiformis]|uniref:Branched-chain amino acid transport system permease protein n=1 Tax=Ancylobacter amanitiformis TaxID=217069 RepID=A0ABU0LW56_9HYPH|nr:branched-chain amino acid ABC transporter ATP-binding protein/permease [Ancylobacter amanitiformis]MDQ0512962.1 branched-chain amino acid transport system permease protein [Ancylobacter amanitiformis]
MTEARRLSLILAAALLALAAIFAGPTVLDTYSVNVLTRSLLYAAVALTVDLLWGYLGILTFGQSVFFACGAYAAGLVFTHMDFTPGNAALALALGIGAALFTAAIVGWLAFWHGASALYASVITLVLPIVATQLLYSGGTFTGSSSGLSGFTSFDLSTEAWFWLAGSFLVAMTTLAYIVVQSDAGRLLVAVRENEQRCKYLGLNTSRLKIRVYLACAVIGAVAGYIYAAYAMVVAPELAGFVFGTELVIWTALGGRGTLLGPVFGALIVDYESAQLSGNFPFVWQLIIGTVFVLVIVAFPRGLLPMLFDLPRRLLGLLRPRAAVARPARVALATLDAAQTQGAEVGNGPALAVTGVARRFGSLTVLDGIDFKARAGELVSLVGPNGAGKTTLMRCIADGAERSAGTIIVNGHDIGRRPPEACVALGVGRKFQMANVFETLTVAECLQIARARHSRPSLWRRAQRLPLPEAAMHVIATTGLDRQLSTPAHLLSHGLKQALELSMVLALEPRVLLLDEPTAGLTKTERMQIGAILIDLAKKQGLCVLLVEHDLDFVREISSRVIVLHQGRIVLDGSVEEVVASELVKQVYAGSGHAGIAHETAPKTGGQEVPA